MTLTTLLAEIRRLINDTSTDTSRQRWSDTILTARVNDVSYEMATRAKCVTDRATDTNIVAATAEYALPTDFLEEDTILYKNSEGVWIRLMKTTEPELDYADGTWRDTDGTPSHYYTRTDGSTNYVGLYPNPDVSRASALRVDYKKIPAALTTGTDVPLDGIRELYGFHRIIAFGVALACCEDNIDDNDTAKKATYFKIEYEKGITNIRGQMAVKSEDTRIINSYEQARTNSRRTA